ncbi:hypothetical protein [Rhizobium sp. Rhizsp42]|uniref:hypothetical protein n=1 Tax=Rhizobium sp. Rhizsp42 TaxID=3243034 RepID=UPI0039AEA023
MTRINHNRPILRLLDNYRRELNRLQRDLPEEDRSRKTPATSVRIPKISQAAHLKLLEMLNAASVYFDTFSSYLKSISPDAKSSVRKKRSAFEKSLEDAKKNLKGTCIHLVIEAMREKIEGESYVIPWLEWFQKEAERVSHSGLTEIFEIGIKPAFEAVAAAIDESASARRQP